MGDNRIWRGFSPIRHVIIRLREIDEVEILDWNYWVARIKIH